MIHAEEDILWVFNRIGGRCFYCGMRLSFENFGRIAERGAWEIGNFIHVSREGESQRDNWVPSCIICETVKGSLFPWEFDARRFRQGDESPNNYIKSVPFSAGHMHETKKGV